MQSEPIPSIFVSQRREYTPHINLTAKSPVCNGGLLRRNGKQSPAFISAGVRGWITGYTLLEAVIAFAVLTAAILGAVALIAHALARASSSRDKLVAINLAQEGIELVRVIRDNNVLCDNLNGPPTFKWNNNPAGGPDLGTGSGHVYTLNVGSTVSLPSPCGSIITPLPNNSTDAACRATSLNIDAVTGLYTYGSGATTPFSRCVRICLPPQHADCNSAANDTDIPASDQMQVISTVWWNEAGGPRSVNLQERLYNWR
ncbi:MAG: hypothetical protein HY006_01955 [Candidatus Sungbacteria bacterium]|nr:hypothetical protein [Candidatus Sungbacteria bacterium]